jgi:thiol-disulfide isomerase/thioredoxin
MRRRCSASPASERHICVRCAGSGTSRRPKEKTLRLEGKHLALAIRLPLFRGMNIRKRVVGLVFMLGGMAQVSAETWRTTIGDRCEGNLSGVYGKMVLITGKSAAIQLPLEHLDDAGLARVADFLAAGATKSQAWSTATSAVAKSLQNRLQVLRDGKLVTFDPGARPEPEVYLAYFGALWCGPCRSFSPELVRTYQQLKQVAPDYFELVFVSSDRDGGEQLSYVREVGMPWPVIKFSALGRVNPIERWAARGIPNLVAVTREGEIIFKSYRGDEYLGPQSVLQQFTDLLLASKGDSTEVKRARHRLAVLQHLRAAQGADATVRPYVVSLDHRRYRTLTITSIMATLNIDDHGLVTEAKFEPELPTAIDFQLNQDAMSWLFLPAVVQGRATGMKVSLPLQLSDVVPATKRGG